MAETRYIISDAARMINVEPHVLRYWEEELAIEIPRNELGHRYYTEKEIHLFENIRDLKEKGFQLKAIRLIITTLNEDAPFGKTGNSEEHVTEEDLTVDHEAQAAGEQKLKEGKVQSDDDEKTEEAEETAMAGEPAVIEKADGERVSAADKMKHFKYIMDGIVTEALVKNNEQIENAMAQQVTDVVIQEISKMEERQDKQSERHYRLLDEAIRGKQRGNQEVAAAKVPSYGVPKMPKRRKHFFKKKFKY